MKKVFVAILAMGLFGCEQSKLGYVDNNDLINELTEKKDIEAKFKTKVEAFNKKKDSLSSIMEMEAKEFQAKAQRMGQKKAQEAYNSLMERRNFIAQQLQQEEQSIQLDSQTQIDSLIKKVKREVKSYAKTNGYTFIFGANEAGSVMYGDDTKNVTADVRKGMNDAYKK